MSILNEPFETRLEQHMVPGKNHAQIPYMVPFRIPHRIAEETCPQFSDDTHEWIDKADQSLLIAAEHGGYGGFVEGLLLRTEALSSSHIEDNPTGFRQLCLTDAGAQSKEWNREAVNNLWVLVEILGTAAETPIKKSVILRDHLNLLPNKDYAGKFRAGGLSRIGESVIDSPYICPPYPEVESLMSDWVRFVSREDIPLIPKIALGHAQFESIHPFANGNGRTGRAIIQRMLLLAGYRTLPVSVALYALRDHYFASLGAYRDGDPEPIVRIVSLALLAASTAISKHIPEIHDLVESWKNRTGAKNGLKKNLSAALEWIASTPAFTADKLAESLGVSVRTAQRISASLVEEEILSQSKKTHPQKDTKQRLKIYEAGSVTRLAEQVEETARECAVAWWGGTPPPGRPVSVAEYSDHGERKANIAARISEMGSHPIMCFPTKSGYDLGISLLELFVFQNGRLVMRRKLKDSMIAGVGGWDTISIYADSYSQLTIDVSKDDDKEVRKFASSVSSDPRLPGGKIWALGQNLRKDYENMLESWGVWESTGGSSKYPGPRLIELGTPLDYASSIGKCADIAFHTQLASFFEPPADQKAFLELRGDQSYLGYSPSLLETVATLGNIGSEQMPSIYDVPEVFNEDQHEALASIKMELDKYDKPSKLLKKVAAQMNNPLQNDKQGQISTVKTIIEQPENQYATEAFICDYLTLARNARAHNRTMLDAERWFLWHADEIAQKRGMPSIRQGIVDRIFGVIKRLETEILGLPSDEADSWNHRAMQDAIKNTQEIGMAIHRNETAKQDIAAHKSTEFFRQEIRHSPRLHTCEPRGGFDTDNMAEKEAELVFERCGECGGFIRILYLDTGAEISTSDAAGTELLSVPPSSCVISEGQFGITEIRLFYESTAETMKAIEETYKHSENLQVSVKHGGRVVWDEMCEQHLVSGIGYLLLKSQENFTLNTYT